MAQAISDKFRQRLKDNSTLMVRGTLTSTSGKTVDLSGPKLMSLSIEQDTSSDSSFDLGGCIAGKLTMSLENSDHSLDSIGLDGATADVSLGAQFGSSLDAGPAGDQELSIEVSEEAGSRLAAKVFRGRYQLVPEEVAKLGMLHWYIDGKQVAVGETCTGVPGKKAICRLEA